MLIDVNRLEGKEVVFLLVVFDFVEVFLAESFFVLPALSSATSEGSDVGYRGGQRAARDGREEAGDAW